MISLGKVMNTSVIKNGVSVNQVNQYDASVSQPRAVDLSFNTAKQCVFTGYFLLFLFILG